MAITTLESLKTCIQPLNTEQRWWGLSGGLSGLKWAVPDSDTGWPVGVQSALSNSPSGEALTSAPCQLPMPIPVSGKTIYVAGVEVFAEAHAIYALMLYDRLWHSGPFVNNTNDVQTVGSVAWPARDRNQSTDGSGVGIALFLSGGGVGTLISYQISYTNSQGTPGRIGLTRTMSSSSYGPNLWIPFYLDVGDFGVRSVESLTVIGTPSNNTHVQLMAYRQITTIGMQDDVSQDPAGIDGNGGKRLAVPLGMPKVFDNSVVCVAVRYVSLSLGALNVNVSWAQG
jgi:hypothetical protein